jgi:glycopeptide antibiotics resistance protein
LKDADRLRFSARWTILGVLAVAVVIYMSLSPLSPFGAAVFRKSDKIMHFSAYATMMFWFGQIYRKRLFSLSVAAGLIALGVLIEILQGLTGYRTFEYLDITANILGVVAGFVLTRTRFGGLFYAFEMLLDRPRD